MKCAVLCFVLLLSVLHVSWGNESCSGPKPDFRAPGRRTSEEKCLEYNWEKKCSSKDGEVNKYSYMGAIAFKEEKGEVRFLCNAFLVSPKFAVAPAHCAKPRLPMTPDFVRFGNQNINGVPVVDAKIARTIVHPKYQAPRYSFDIALFEFESALPVSQTIAPACLWSQPDIATDQNYEVPAWAWDTIENNSTNDVLRTMTVQVLDTKTCESQVKEYYTRRFRLLEDHQLCANEANSKIYFLRGSSGAPIITTVPVGDGDEMPYAQAFAHIGFAHRLKIGIYVKISSFVDWIEQTVWP